MYTFTPSHNFCENLVIFYVCVDIILLPSFVPGPTDTLEHTVVSERVTNVGKCLFDRLASAFQVMISLGDRVVSHCQLEDPLLYFYSQEM